MKKHLFLIDDEAAIRDLLTAWFGANDFLVTAVGSAAEAIKAAQRGPFDLIIADLHLEDGSSLEMIARLKATLPATPVILLTGMPLDSDAIRRMQREHHVNYLEKTTPLAEVLGTARRLIESSPLIDPVSVGGS